MSLRHPVQPTQQFKQGLQKMQFQKEGGQILCVQNMYLKRGGADLVHALHVLTHIITLVGGSKRI